MGIVSDPIAETPEEQRAIYTELSKRKLLPRLPNTVASDANVVMVQHFYTVPCTIYVSFADHVYVLLSMPSSCMLSCLALVEFSVDTCMCCRIGWLQHAAFTWFVPLHE